MSEALLGPRAMMAISAGSVALSLFLLRPWLGRGQQVTAFLGLPDSNMVSKALARVELVEVAYRSADQRHFVHSFVRAQLLCFELLEAVHRRCLLQGATMLVSCPSC